MRVRSAESILVASDSSSDAGEADSDSEAESSDTETQRPALTPADKFLRCLIKAAQKLKNTPEGNEILTNLVAASPVAYERATKRRLEDILNDSRKRSKKRKAELKRLWLCVVCDQPFTAKDDLKVHLETCKEEEPAEPKKAFPCDKCDKSYVNKANLKRHVQGKHVNVATAERTRSIRYKCALCKDVRNNIKLHYGSKHKIDNVEQVLIENGRVLVHSDIDPDGGNAPWFKEQLEKAKGRYKGAVCRLCDVDLEYPDLLKGHYTEQHKVDANSLDSVQRLFRSEMNAHLGETSNPRRADKKVNVTDKKKVNIKDRPQNRDTTRIIYKCKCRKATDSYDAAVQHSQEHLVAKHTGNEMADTRNFSFETNINDKNVIKVIHYDFENLLTESWFEIFNDMTTDKERILSSSIFMFSRSVKLHSEDSDSTVGIPAYKCDMCQLFVDPTKIENHCKNYDTCAKNKPKGHYCEVCDAHFYSAKALTYHKENHAAGFKVVTFNHKNDAQINKILGKLQNRSDDSQEEEEEVIEENTKRHASSKQIEIQQVEVFCNQCNKCMDVSVIEAHYAEHKKVIENLRITIESGQNPNDIGSLDVGNQSGSATRQETELLQQNNHVDNRMQTEDEDPTVIVSSKTTGMTREIGNVSSDTENTDNVVGNESATRETEQPQGNPVDTMQAEDEDVTMNDVNENGSDVEGTVEPWESDDSCPGPYSISVQADINISVTENIANETAGSPEVVLKLMFSADSEPITSGDESLPCTQELQQLFASDSENDPEEQTNATNNDKLPSTQELQQMLEKDDAGNENREEQERHEASRGFFTEDTIEDQNEESVEANMADSEEKEPNEPQENVSGNGAKRMSSRDILNELISDEEIDYFNQTAYIKSLLCSRD